MVRVDIRPLYFPPRVVLLGFVLLFGVSLAGCNRDSTSDFIKRHQAQEKAIAALTDLGAKITKSDTGLAQGWAVDLSQVPFTREIAVQLKLLENSMSVLNLSGTSIDDNQLADLIDQSALNAVAELNLSHNPAITDQALDKIASILHLRDLDLVETQVTEAGIARLRATRKPRRPIPNHDNNEAMNRLIPEGMQKSALEVYKNELKIRH